MLRSKDDKAVASICNVWYIYIYVYIYIYGYIRQHSWQMYLDLHIVGWLVHFFRCFPRRSTMFVRFCLPKVLPHMEAASWTLKLGDFTDISQMCWSNDRMMILQGAGHVLGTGSLRRSIVDQRRCCQCAVTLSDTVFLDVSCFGIGSSVLQGCQNDKDIRSFHYRYFDCFFSIRQHLANLCRECIFLCKWVKTLIDVSILWPLLGGRTVDIATCAQRVNWRTGRNPRPGQGAMGPWGHGCKGKEVSGIGGVESNMITEHYRFWSEHTNRSLESRLYDILWYFMIFHVIYYVFFFCCSAR